MFTCLLTLAAFYAGGVLGIRYVAEEEWPPALAWPLGAAFLAALALAQWIDRTGGPGGPRGPHAPAAG